MKKKLRWILACVLLAVVLAVVACSIWTRRAIDVSSHVVSTSTPLSLAQARQKNCPIDLPNGADNVCFAAYSEWLAFEVYVKFDAPLDICKCHAIQLLKKHNEKVPDRAVPLELRILKAPLYPIKPGPPLNIRWFDLDAIKHGFFAGGEGPNSGAHQPFIWIDSDGNTFYYLCTD